jgi:excisionase family DNA binding protein
MLHTERHPHGVLLDVEQVASRLRLSPETIRRRYTRALPFLKVGGKLRLAESDLVAYIESRKAARA